MNTFEGKIAIVTERQVAPHNRLFWWLYRLSPALYSKLMQEGVKQMRPLRQEPTVKMEDIYEHANSG